MVLGKRPHPENTLQHTFSIPHVVSDGFDNFHMDDGSDEAPSAKRQRMLDEQALDVTNQEGYPDIHSRSWNSWEDEELRNALVQYHGGAGSRSAGDACRQPNQPEAANIEDTVWDFIASSIFHGTRTPLQCYRRYLKLSESHSYSQTVSQPLSGTMQPLSGTIPAYDETHLQFHHIPPTSQWEVEGYYDRPSQPEVSGLLQRGFSLEMPLGSRSPIISPIQRSRKQAPTNVDRGDPSEYDAESLDLHHPISGSASANVGSPIPSERPWTLHEHQRLRSLVEKYRNTAPPWDEISTNFFDRSATDCLAAWHSITKPPVIKGKGSWTPEEDQMILKLRHHYGPKWAQIATHLPGRQGKQCRERFVNHLDPEVRKGEWSHEEETLLISLHQQHGNKWATICKHLPGRSDNDTKNHWYSNIQRRIQRDGLEVRCLSHSRVVLLPRKSNSARSPHFLS
jgi:Myb-like DNA-binding domain